MFFQGMLQSFGIGSDLYMLLTGFLCMNKEFGIGFYKSGLKVVLSYLFFSVLTIFVDIYFFHNGMTWTRGMLGIFSFTTIPYAWYIEMWIGLFLLAPFLNKLYKSLETKRMKQWLVFILFLLTALPDFANRYGMYLAPAFWEGTYPVMFYLIGCYIREYRPDFPKWKLGLGMLAIVSAAPVFNVIVDYPTYLQILGDRNGIACVPLSVMLFLSCYNLEVKSKWLRLAFEAVSLRSLDIFLCSSVFDAGIYPYFKERYFIDQSQFGIYFFVIIPCIFALSFSIATVKRMLFKGVERALGNFVPMLPRLT